jgi:SWI/SNF related-matrix-associated actin-dependent regulator of chromatin subfamily C
MMNVGHVGENAPGGLALRGGSSSGKGKRSFEEVQRSTFWSKERLEELDGLVVKYAKSSGSNDAPASVEGAQPPQPPQATVDWEVVANEIGEGVSAADCQRAFLDPPKVDDVSVKIAKTPGGFDLSTILDGVHPDVLNATINASLKATNDVVEARKASIAGIIASAAVMKGQSEEEEIAQTLMDILDQRMQRLENRVAILDDVEALLEAERVALELERRDMYTTRCRHWFGDGSS